MVMFSVAAATTGRTAWEYKIIAGHLLPYEKQDALGPQIDHAAADGWEVVAPANDNGFLFVILRRAK
jgi:hypothetical protein